MKRRKIPKVSASAWTVVAATLFAACAVRNTKRLPASLVPSPALNASAGELVDRTNARSREIETMTAKVDFAPTAGSVYSGVIKEYHDVRGFILYRKPALIRILGQAPVVRTNIFDMVSDGDEFRVYIPPKHKFIVGKTAVKSSPKNALESMRPQHILDALLIPAVDSGRDRVAFEEAEEGARRFYVLTVFAAPPAGEMYPARRVWFDRASLEVSRLELFEDHGRLVEDVGYSDYRDFHGVRYPGRIDIRRPAEDYQLAISVKEATFNQPIAREKFELAKPEGAQLVELSEAAPSAGRDGADGK